MRPAICILLAILACSRRQPDEGGARRPTTPAPAPTVTSPASSPPPAPMLGTGLAALPAQLAREARERPKADPRAEDVLAALKASGVQVAGAKQVLARTVGARFCLGGRTARGLAVSVCEFEDAASAAEARRRSLERWQPVAPGRVVVVQGTTMLTLAGARAPATQEEIRRATEAFTRL